MNARFDLINATEDFESPALAIVTRCRQSGVTLWVEKGDHIKAKGSRKIIEAWQAIIKRHKSAVIAVLTGKPLDSKEEMFADEALKADHLELTICIIELCEIVGHSHESRKRILDARKNLYPYQYPIACAYFLWQRERAKAGGYWEGSEN